MTPYVLTGLRRRTKAGFTLIEILAAVAILGLMALFLGRIFSESSRIWKLGSKRVESNGTGRSAIEFLSREIGTAVADGVLELEVQSDHDQVQFGSEIDANKSDRLTFACATHEPQINSSVGYVARAFRQNTYRVIAFPLGTTTNYCLIQHSLFSHRSITMYPDDNWTTSFSDAAKLGNSSVVAENIRSFEVFATTTDGQPAYSYKSWTPGAKKLWYIDVYLEVLAEDDARKATLGLKSEELDTMTRRYHTRVFMPNTMGYSRDET